MQPKNEFKSKYQTPPAAADMSFGRIPPQAQELERAILGAIMVDKAAYDNVSGIISSETFYSDANRLVFASMQSLVTRNMPIDLLTVVEELKRSGDLEKVGGAYEVSKFTNDVVSGAHVETHARIILQKFITREMIRVCSELITDSYNESIDVFELLDRAEEEVLQIGVKNVHGGMSEISKVLNDAVNMVEKWRQTDGSTTGVQSGYEELDRCTRGWQPGDLIIIGARPAVGKCLGLGTKVIMFDGSLKKVEDVIVGDLLMGDDSTPRTVLSLARGVEMMYNVKQVRGVEYRINESHILSLMASRNQGLSKHGDKIDLPLTKYLSNTKKFQNNWKGYKVAIDFPAQPLSIPPYMLGIWLGDGTSAKPEVSKPDAEIMHYMSGYADGVGLKMNIKTPKNRCKSYTISSWYKNDLSESFSEKLKRLKVFKNKHIPKEYLCNTRENRLQILAGLLDTDGYLQPNGGYEIVQKSEKLIKDIKFLCDSLGFRTNLVNKIGTIKSIGFSAMYYRLTINGDIWNIPVKIERKKWHKQTRERDSAIAGLTITKDKVDNYYGFVIDGNSRFLLEDCTVTHNTAFALNLVRNAALGAKPTTVAVWSLEMKAVYLAIRMMAAESEIYMHKLQTGNMEDWQMAKLIKNGVDKLKLAKIFFDESSSVTLAQVRAKARKLKKKNNLGLIVIDYLQLMGSENSKGNREQEISKISRGLKNLAQELDIPIIALSQLSRESAKGITYENGPGIDSLRESGAIEQDADLILMLWGPTDAEAKENADLEGRRKVKIAKQRSGSLATIELQFRNEIQLFKAIDEKMGTQYDNVKMLPVQPTKKIAVDNDVPF